MANYFIVVPSGNERYFFVWDEENNKPLNRGLPIDRARKKLNNYLTRLSEEKRKSFRMMFNRALLTGSSSVRFNLEQTIRENEAGPEGEHLPLNELIETYCK